MCAVQTARMAREKKMTSDNFLLRAARYRTCGDSDRIVRRIPKDEEKCCLYIHINRKRGDCGSLQLNQISALKYQDLHFMELEIYTGVLRSPFSHTLNGHLSGQLANKNYSSALAMERGL